MAINIVENWKKNNSIEVQNYKNQLQEYTINFGIKVIFLPRKYSNEIDYIIGEDINSTHENSFELYAIHEDSVELGGGWDFNNLGLNIEHQIQLDIPIHYFKKSTGGYEPKTDDIIYLPTNRLLFNIEHVNDINDEIYRYNQPMIYNIKLSHYKYSHESIETDTEADDVYEHFDEKDYSENKSRQQLNDELLDNISLDKDTNIFGDIDIPVTEVK